MLRVLKVKGALAVDGMPARTLARVQLLFVQRDYD